MDTLERQRSLVSAATIDYAVPGSLELESGTVLDGVNVAYRTWGELNAEGSNAVLICHALTGSADADDWWPGLIGAGCALDPARDFIVCSNVLGGCYGTTGPLSARPGHNSRYGGQFPEITVRDMVALQRRLLEHLGVRSLELVLGPSLGGMQVLEWALMHADMVQAIAPIGVSGRHSAWCIGISEAQRQAIFADPRWDNGNYPNSDPPVAGLAAARMMAMLSYRSWKNFDDRFGRQLNADGDFQVESYLRYQGSKLNTRFDAMTYVRLTEAMDSHDVARGRGDYRDVLNSLSLPALVVSVSSDVLYPPHEQQELADCLPQSSYRVLESAHGHDGFLIDTESLGNLITEFRNSREAAARLGHTG